MASRLGGARPGPISTENIERWWGLAIPATVAVLTVLAFSPTFDNGVVDWDDTGNLRDNESYRGLGWTQLKWMFTTVHMGHYIPLTWLTFGIDYVVWGMDLFGYHLTNLLLHAANAVLAYLIAVRLLAVAVPALSAEWLARALVSQGRPAEALEEFRETVRIRPADAVARYNLGNILAGLGRLDEAAVQFREALRLNPGLREAQVRLERLAGERARSAR